MRDFADESIPSRNETKGSENSPGPEIQGYSGPNLPVVRHILKI
jgi:hypothetical protein